MCVCVCVCVLNCIIMFTYPLLRSCKKYIMKKMCVIYKTYKNRARKETHSAWAGCEEQEKEPSQCRH